MRFEEIAHLAHRVDGGPTLADDAAARVAADEHLDRVLGAVDGGGAYVLFMRGGATCH